MAATRKPEAPAHLSDAARSAWAEIVEGGETASELASLEAVCVQIARARDAQARIDAEGLVVAGAKGEPVPHPAIAIERAAQTEVHRWAAAWRKGAAGRQARRSR